MIELRTDSTLRQRKDEILGMLVDAFSDFIYVIARRRWKQFRMVNGLAGLSDIVSAGREGFLRSIERWRGVRGTPLSHLASKWITYTCLSEALRLHNDGFMVPYRVRKFAAQYVELRETLGRSVADRLLESLRLRNATRLLVREMCAARGRRVRSLHEAAIPWRETSAQQSLLDVIPDPHGGMETIEVHNLLEYFRSYLFTHCSPRERYIVEALYAMEAGRGEAQNYGGFAKVLRDRMLVAQSLGISKERVRQILAAIEERFLAHLGCRETAWQEPGGIGF